MPKLPGKFDDISKAASSVLKDDLDGSNKSSFVSKAKTNVLGGGSLEVNTSVDPAGQVATPAKLTFKFATPLSFLPGFAIDKFELDKEGKTALETSLSKDLHKVEGLKVDVKAGGFKFTAPETAASNLAFACAYTGMKGHAIKVDAKMASITQPSIETLHIVGPTVVGLQLKKPHEVQIPDVGVNYQTGDAFVAAFGKAKLSKFTVLGQYKVSDDCSVAASYGTDETDGWAIGGSTRISSDLTAKAKLENKKKDKADDAAKMTLLMSLKKTLAKGTTVNVGMNYDVAKAATSFGIQAKIE